MNQFYSLFCCYKLPNVALSSSAESGDRYRRDGARPAAREVRAGERRGGRRRRRRGDGGQSGGLETVLRGRLVGEKKHQRRNVD